MDRHTGRNLTWTRKGSQTSGIRSNRSRPCPWQQYHYLRWLRQELTARISAVWKAGGKHKQRDSQDLELEGPGHQVNLSRTYNTSGRTQQSGEPEKGLRFGQVGALHWWGARSERARGGDRRKTAGLLRRSESKVHGTQSGEGSETYRHQIWCKCVFTFLVSNRILHVKFKFSFMITDTGPLNRDETKWADFYRWMVTAQIRVYWG